MKVEETCRENAGLNKIRIFLQKGFQPIVYL